MPLLFCALAALATHLPLAGVGEGSVCVRLEATSALHSSLRSQVRISPSLRVLGVDRAAGAARSAILFSGSPLEEPLLVELTSTADTWRGDVRFPFDLGGLDHEHGAPFVVLLKVAIEWRIESSAADAVPTLVASGAGDNELPLGLEDAGGLAACVEIREESGTYRGLVSFDCPPCDASVVTSDRAERSTEVTELPCARTHPNG